MRFQRFCIILPFFLLLALSACRRTSVSSVADLTLALTAAGFVGNQACVVCHAAECKAHRDGRHANAMRAAQPAILKTLIPPAGPVPLAGYVLETQAQQLVLTRFLPPKGPVPLHLVLGSGKVGLTFVSIQSADTLLETHMSYFPEGKQWDYTPGHEIRQKEDGVFGRVQHNPDARRCLGCYAVTLPDNALAPEPRFYGVGCESCLGPGQKHIAAIQRGDHGDTGMEPLQRLPSEKLNNLCGKCHRALKDVDVESTAGTQTQRFQPYALTRSRCRNADGSVLSCLTCHTPHENVSTDLRSYEQTCLKCHTTLTNVPEPDHVSHLAHAKSCPVNARDGCIRCHMRDRQAFLGLFWKPMVDHLISIPSKQRK